MKKNKFSIIFRFVCIVVLTSFITSSCGTEQNSEVSTNSLDTINVTFVADEGGYIIGGINQNLEKGEGSAMVRAVPNLCYVFKEWSDGVKTAERSGDVFTADTTITALFEYCGLPKLYVSYTDDKIHKAYPIDAKFTMENTFGDYGFEKIGGVIQGRGNSTWEHDKKPYKIKLDVAANLLGIGEDAKRDWVLLSNHDDQSLFRNYYAYNLANKIGIGYKSTFVEVYLNGKYNGVYLLTGKVEASRHDVEVEKDGFIIELDGYYSGDEGKDYFRAGNECYTIQCDMTRRQIKKAQKYILDVGEAISSGREEQIRKYIDVDSFVDMYLLQELTKNTDAGWSSFYMYKKDAEDKLHMGPAWDFDIAMGNDFRLDNGGYDGIYVGRESGMDQQMWWFIQLCRQEWFRNLVKERWNEGFKGKALEMLQETINYKNLNEKDIEKNFDLWGRVFGQRVNTEPDHIIRLNSHKEHFDFFIKWMNERYSWLDNCFNDEKLWKAEIKNRKYPSNHQGLLPK